MRFAITLPQLHATELQSQYQNKLVCGPIAPCTCKVLCTLYLFGAPYPPEFLVLLDHKYGIGSDYDYTEGPPKLLLDK